MADKKISELTALTGANVATDDQLVIVDTSAALTKNITIDEFKNALDTATGFVRITGDTMTGDLVLSGADVTFGDNNKAIFGAASELEIFHTGSASNITSTNDPLKISATTTSSTANIILEGDASPILSLRASGSNDDKITFKSDGAFQYINTNDQLTIQTGTNDALFLFGSSNIRTDALGGTHTISSRAGDISFITGTSGSTTERMNIAGAGGISVSADMSFGDNDKAIFGAGSDLQIYHGGNHSFISEQGTGNLKILADSLVMKNAADTQNYVTGTSGGAAALFYAGSEKLATTSTGIDVTGTVTADGLTVDTNTLHVDASNNRVGIGTSSPDFPLHVSSTGVVFALNSTSGAVAQRFNENGTARFFINTLDGSNGIKFINGDGTSERMRIDSNGNVGIGTASPSTFNQRVTAPHLVVGTGGNAAGLTLYSGTSSQSSINFAVGTTTSQQYDGGFVYVPNSGSPYLGFHVNAGAERMRIDSDGVLSFSETSTASFPAGSINRYNNGFTYITGSTNGLILKDAAASGSRLQIESATMRFETSGSEAMRIDSSGNTHIGGTTSITTAVTGDNVAPKLIVEGTTATSIAVLRQDTSIVSGNSLGSLGFYGTDTTSNTPTPLAGIQALASGTHAAGDNPTDLRFFTTPDGNSTMAEAMRIDSSGNLLVGTTTTQNLGTVNSGSLIRDGYIQVASTSASATLAYFYGSSGQVGSIGVTGGNNVNFSATAANHGGIMFSDAGSSQPTINPCSSGSTLADGSLNIGGPTYRFKNLYLSGGVYLGGTGSANKLDDYEEGTWTPTAFTGSCSANKAWYTKVGNLVTVAANIFNFSDTSSSNAVGIKDLPFTSSSDASASGAMIGRYISSSTGYSAYIGPSSTVVYFYEAPEASNSYESMKHSDLGGSTSDFNFLITYRVG